jgi:membrane fusion protein, heavy metal efflux system
MFRTWIRYLGNFLPFIVLAVVAAAYFILNHSRNDADSESVLPGVINKLVVELTPQKLKRIGIELQPIKRSEWRRTVTLPGRLDYNLDHRVEVKSASDGIVTEIRVHPGDSVQRGAVVALVSSPEVGRLRSELKQRQAAVELAESKHAWQTKIRDGVLKLSMLIESNVEPKSMDEQLGESVLGEYREGLMTAYTRYILAKKMTASLDETTAAGMSQRVVDQRETERQAAQAALKSILEQTQFDSARLSKESNALLEDAKRQASIAGQQLATLLGPAASNDELTSESVGLPGSPTISLSEIAIVAPIEGTIEERFLSTNQRVTAGESLFVIANTKSLWAYADVRERDWSTMNAELGQSVSIEVPAIPDCKLRGKIAIIGRRVDSVSGVAPLIAELDENDDRLRPGLFIRMTVATSKPRTTISVPEKAILTHDGKTFLFVSESSTRFRRVDVEVGEKTANHVEVTSKLADGTQIVVAGAFALKSELLLSGEDE